MRPCASARQATVYALSHVWLAFCPFFALLRLPQGSVRETPSKLLLHHNAEDVLVILAAIK